MTPEQLAIAFAFTFIVGTAAGRALTIKQFDRMKAIGEASLYNSDWWASHPSSQSELHRVQDVTGDMPPAPRQMKIYRGSGWDQRLWDCERWRAPRLRKAR